MCLCKSRAVHLFTPNTILDDVFAGDYPMGLLLLIIVVLLLVGGLPTWPYSRRWGYGPSGTLGTVLLIVLVLVLLDYVPRGF